MAQGKLKITHKKAVELVEEMREAYTDNTYKFDRCIKIHHETNWWNGEPNEYSWIELVTSGQKGIPSEMIQCLAEINCGFEQPYNNTSSEGGISHKHYNISSYENPSWSWANPMSSGIDKTRPNSEREDKVVQYMKNTPEEDWKYVEPRE